MDSSSIELVGSDISGVTVNGSEVRVHFERAIIIKTMTGSVEKTRWWQKGDIVFEAAEVIGELPEAYGECEGGDVGENIYTYRDMIPLPLESRGRAHCDLRISGQQNHIHVQAEAVHLDMFEVPKYIEHIRPD